HGSTHSNSRRAASTRDPATSCLERSRTTHPGTAGTSWRNVLRESDFASRSSALPARRVMTNVEHAAAGIGSTPRDVEGFRLRQFTPDDFEAVHSILSSRDDMTWEHVQ